MGKIVAGLRTPCRNAEHTARVFAGAGPLIAERSVRGFHRRHAA